MLSWARRLQARRSLWIVALAAMVSAAAWPMQVNGWNQNAHYALVRALAQGTPFIDRTRHEIGDLGTGDVSAYGGHVYANKAPGLAFATMPAFLVVEAIGMRTTGDPTRVIWALHLWSVVIPFALLLVLVRRVAERVEPGLGTSAAVALGLGTLVLPFATLFFAHVLSAALGFAAFAVISAERDRVHRLPFVGAAGALAGLAVTTEYHLAIVAVVVGVYALVRDDWLRRGLAYAGGVALGALPLLLFNTWAFGTPFRHTYENNLTGRDDPLTGFFGASTPDAQILSDLLFSAWGLVTLTPVVAAAAVGCALILRGPRRAEGLVALGVTGLYLLWASSLGLGVSPFGGLGPPRYLIPMLPFLAVGLAVALRRFPLATAALAAISAFQMVAQTATNPLAAYDGGWYGRLVDAEFLQTAASLVGLTGAVAYVPFFIAVVVAAGCGAWAARGPRASPVDTLAALLATVAWAVAALRAANPAGGGFPDDYVAGVTLTVALVVAAAAVAGRFGGLRPARIIRHE